MLFTACGLVKYGLIQKHFWRQLEDKCDNLLTLSSPNSSNSLPYSKSFTPPMATSISALTSSLSSVSFSSQISQRPLVQSISFPYSKSLSFKTPNLTIAATAAVETADLKTLVKSRLPGGFAAQNIIGTGRRKSAIARVVLQEGSGKIIINYRDVNVNAIFC